MVVSRSPGLQSCGGGTCFECVVENGIIQAAGLFHRRNAHFFIQELAQVIIAPDRGRTVATQIHQADTFPLQVFLQPVKIQGALDGLQSGPEGPLFFM